MAELGKLYDDEMRRRDRDLDTHVEDLRRCREEDHSKHKAEVQSVRMAFEDRLSKVSGIWPIMGGGVVGTFRSWKLTSSSSVPSLSPVRFSPEG